MRILVALTLAALALAQNRPFVKFWVNQPTTSTPGYTRFANWVDLAMSSGNQYAYEAFHPALLHKINGQAKYCTEAVGLVDEYVAGEEAKIAANTNPDIAGDSYLEVGGYIQNLALTYDECYSNLDATMRGRWEKFANQSIWNVWNYQKANWNGRLAPWSGWSVTNPGNNYHYSFLLATMTWALAKPDATWTALLVNDKLPKLTGYWANPPDGGPNGAGGGSREGTGYGTSHMRLFQLYQIWKATRGEDLSIVTTHCRDSIDYWVHATLPDLEYFTPYGDQARVSDAPLYDYQRILMSRAQSLNPGTQQARRAAWWMSAISIDQMTSGFNYYEDMTPIEAASSPLVPAELYYHSPFTGHFFARTSWTSTATFLSYSAGPYTESHAAQEQGGLSLFNGGWQAVTQNIHSHSGINQDVPTHNTLLFTKGATKYGQKYGSISTMTSALANNVITINSVLTPAMAVSGNPVSMWTRQVVFDLTTSDVDVTDAFTLNTGVNATWQLNVPNQPTWDGVKKEVRAGALTITCLDPPTTPVPTFVDWKALDASENSGGGYKIMWTGGTTGYHFKIKFGNAVQPSPTPPPTPVPTLPPSNPTSRPTAPNPTAPNPTAPNPTAANPTSSSAPTLAGPPPAPTAPTVMAPAPTPFSMGAGVINAPSLLVAALILVATLFY